MNFNDFDLIENNKGELVAIKCQTSSVYHFEIFAAANLPSPITVTVRPYDDKYLVKASVLLPTQNATFSVECFVPNTRIGPVGVPDVTHIAMSLSDTPQVVAIKFRGTWTTCWHIP